MFLFFAHHDPEVCCLCGSSGNLTGEHKFKRSAIADEFDGAKMVIGRFGEGENSLCNAQGPKSKALHFAARLCAVCNGSRTQDADRAFDKFNRACREACKKGGDPASIFHERDYPEGSDEYLNVFRYFAKLLCCHMAESGAPRPVGLARFAIGASATNRIWLEIKRDPTYANLSQVIPDQDMHQYASHGGLAIYGDKNTYFPNTFHSSLTFGPVQYVFHMRVNSIEHITLGLFHTAFIDRCRKITREAIKNPIAETDADKIGIKRVTIDEK